jgi:nucleotide-binding universal stress UspA family protein
MTTKVATQALVEHPSREVGKPVLVATDGLPQSDGAIIVGTALASARGADLHILAVQRPLALIVPHAPELLEPDIGAKLIADLTRVARAQCRRVAPATANAPAPEPEVLTGDPSQIVSHAALDRGAQLVVVGIGEHDVLDRMFGDETALKLARVSRVPLLAIPAWSLTIPGTAVVGIDFSEASVQAARTAQRLLPAGGALYLVHVIPRERQLLEPWLTERAYDRIVNHNFRRLRARVGERLGISVHQTIRVGDPGRALLEYGQQVGADLIATGSHGHGFVSRFVLGSTTTKVLRGAHCAVLVVPSGPFAAEEVADGSPATVPPPTRS